MMWVFEITKPATHDVAFPRRPLILVFPKQIDQAFKYISHGEAILTQTATWSQKIKWKINGIFHLVSLSDMYLVFSRSKLKHVYIVTKQTNVLIKYN